MERKRINKTKEIKIRKQIQMSKKKKSHQTAMNKSLGSTDLEYWF